MVRSSQFTVLYSHTMTKKKKLWKKPKAAPRVEKPEAEKAKLEAVAPAPAPVKAPPEIETLRGMKDILPGEERYWDWICQVVGRLARDYGFGWIETPILEFASLFIRGVGKQTDIVEKELYRFTDQGGEDVALRPEGTAPIVRAYINHGMLNLPQPVKLWYWFPMFRYDRPQAGRYREHHQFGFEMLGEAKPVVDAELIMLAYNLTRECGIPVTTQINSIGSPASRENYKQQLVNFYKSRRAPLCEDCKRRLVKNPLRLLDCKVESCVALRADAPHLVDWIDEDSKTHFMKVLEYLDEVEIPYVLNPHLVRGLDYYNRTVFELWPDGDEERAQNSLGGGGRYDGLAELLGGRPTPACGFAMGVERLILAQKARTIEPPALPAPAIFVAQLGEQAKRKAMVLFEECRRAGLPSTQAFAKDSLKSQLEVAHKAGARFTLILGQKEVLDGTVIIRDMDSGVQEIIDQKKVIADIKKKLETAGPRPGGEAPPPEVIPEEPLDESPEESPTPTVA